MFYLLGALLAPLRVALAFIVLFLVWPFALLQVVGLSEEKLKEPLKGWRNSIAHGSVYFLSRLMFFLLGFMRIRVRGRQASRLEAPILVAAPHSTFFDPIILLPCDLPKVVSRTENLHVPVIGALLRFNQAILVSRHDPASRKKVVEEVKRRATSRGKWPQVLFFPEGTCSNKKALLKFKPGAFIAGVPIQPVLIRYPNSLDSTTWAWRGPGVLKVIWLTASQLCTTVEVEFLPVYHPSAEESTNPTLYASNVQKTMAQALSIPATECEFVGNLPVCAVGCLRVALEPQLWELSKALRKMRWTPGGNLQPPLSNGPERLGHQELARWLGLAHLEVANGLHTFFQQDEEGRVDSREVQLALQALEGTHSPKELTQLAFQLFCEQQTELEEPRLCQEAFCTILRLVLGTPLADGAELYATLGGIGIHGGLSIGQFQDFTLNHPDYAPLFTTYLCPPMPTRGAPIPHSNGSLLNPPKSKAD
ncbi:lysophospholipid acyltransferase LPCAT4 isoform X1 [Alligator sinensis]|uniref:Lysophospholipid acyltransferase LPCAT4 isoform X1 n=2 Tax=Alligator sinensis TaxID=38654 RepID=A0A3Q0H018_ALLSI|nr:lysophospholipid acyltransferase LPCAT4 isoform X1 [Alligator sinensis]